MKKTVLLFAGLLICTIAHAQQSSSIAFQNDATSLVSNALTGMLVKTNDHIVALLYFGPDGSTNEDIFMPLPPTALVGSPAPGRYNGGTRTIASPDPLNGAMIQVRAWEATYGSSYEEALAAPAANGRRALAGKSRIARVSFAVLTNMPSARVVGPFTVSIVGGGGPSALSVGDLAVAEGSNGVVLANFKISLSSTQAEAVSVNFATQDGSALAGQDYVATNGTATFAPGEILKIVSVEVTADGPQEPDENFFLVLSNPVNGYISRPQGACTITEVRITSLTVDTSISFNTLVNRRYVLEKSSDAATWQPVSGATNVLGNGGIVTVLDRGVGCQGMVLYRASLLQQ